MKTGRNDPCVCGSGKKYKKCCLPNEQQEVVSARQAEQVRHETPKEPPAHAEKIAYQDGDLEMLFDDNDAALTRCWNDFQAADYEGRIKLFFKALEQREVLDDELAFDMLVEIHTTSIKNNERGRIAELLDAFEAQLPEVYASSAHDYLAWRIENALALAEHDKIPPLAEALGGCADKNIDLFVAVREQLAYHGQLSALLAAMHAAYPKVYGNDGILKWGQDEFVEQAMKFVMFDCLERTNRLDLSDPDFLSALRQYGPIDPEKLASVAGHLSGERRGTWTLSDFQQDAVHEKRDCQGGSDEPTAATLDGRLHVLGLEFIDYLHRQLDMPYTKAHLGASELCNYLVDRSARKVQRKTDVSARTRHRKPNTVSSKRSHPLCPDKASLQRYLEYAQGFLMNRQYPLVAALELIPAWMDYLLSRGLCDVADPAAVIAAIRPLCQERINLFEQTMDDPFVPKNLKTTYGLET